MLLRSTLLAPDHALPLRPATDRSVWDPATGSVDRATVAAVRERATADLGTGWPQPLASAAARVHRDGERDGWEQQVFARQRRLTRAAVMAATSGEDHWFDEVVDGIILLCEQSSWCWPAHDDTFERHGSVLPTVTDPFVDLGAGEAVAQLAWIDHLLGAGLDQRYPGIRTRVRHEARVRVFDPFLTRRDWHWIGLDGHVHNWNPWIHGNVLIAALRLLDGTGEEDLRAHVVELTAEGLGRYVAAVPADGAIDEGYEYWWNGACRALEALDLLATATGNSVDRLSDVPSLRETIAFPHRMQLGDGWVLNLADGQARPVEQKPWHALHRFARRIGDDDARAFAASHRTPGAPVAHESEGAGRLLRAMTDADWLSADPDVPPLPRDVWLPSVQVLLARAAAGSAAGLTLALKGGHNGENHNHNDVGSFVVASDGVPVIVDAGRPTYTKQTFGPARYDIWCMHSAWHNVPEIAGHGQSVGAQAAASVIEVEIADARSYLSLEISAAYEAPGLRSWQRSASLDRASGLVTVADLWSRDDSVDAPTLIRMLVAGAVDLLPDGALITPLRGAPLVRVRWPRDITARAETRRVDDPMLSSVWGESLVRIELDVSSRRDVAVQIEQVTVERDTVITEDRS